jgi:hypothetical protein
MLGREGCKFFPLFVNLTKKNRRIKLNTFSEILSKLMNKTCPKEFSEACKLGVLRKI